MSDNVELEANHAAAIIAAVETERAKWAASADAVAAASDALKEERARAEELLAHKGEVDAALEAARARLAHYERGYGIAEAAADQESLRAALRVRDADIARLTRAAGAQLDAYDLLSEIARRLAKEAGKKLGPSGDIFALYPELELRRAVETEADRLRTLNAELMRQNDALEAERTMHLRQLRVHAEQMGGSALKYLGLTGEQLVLVNEFAENVRSGSVELPVTDRTRVRNHTLFEDTSLL